MATTILSKLNQNPILLQSSRLQQQQQIPAIATRPQMVHQMWPSKKPIPMPARKLRTKRKNQRKNRSNKRSLGSIANYCKRFYHGKNSIKCLNTNWTCSCILICPNLISLSKFPNFYFLCDFSVPDLMVKNACWKQFVKQRNNRSKNTMAFWVTSFTFCLRKNQPVFDDFWLFDEKSPFLKKHFCSLL